MKTIPKGRRLSPGNPEQLLKMLYLGKVTINQHNYQVYKSDSWRSLSINMSESFLKSFWPIFVLPKSVWPELSGVSVCRLILPDVVVLIVAIVVLVVCKKLFAPANPSEESQPADAGGGSSVVHRRTKHKSVVVEGIQSFIAMLLCAFAAVILPSAISGLYFMTFLLVITWWSFYRSWGQRFYHMCIVWLLYSGAHIFTLYLYQFPFFQEAVPPENFYARWEYFIPILLKTKYQRGGGGNVMAIIYWFTCYFT